MLSYRQIEVFHEVYRRQSIIGAAKALNVSQPSVSKTLQYAEYKLGYPLFERAGRGVRPTLEAEKLYEKSQVIEQATNEFRLTAQNLSKLTQETLRIGVTPSLGIGLLPRLLARFTSVHSNSSFHIKNLQSLELNLQMRQEAFDFVFCFNPTPDEELQRITLERGSLVLLTSKSSATKPSTSSLEALSLLPMIRIFHLSTDETQQSLDEHLARYNIQLNWVAETESIPTAAALVQAGVGSAIIDSINARKLLNDELDILPIEPIIHTSIGALFPKGRLRSFAAREFRSFIIKEFRGK